MTTATRVLLTGATGYVGGLLLPRLEARDDLRVRCLTRRPEALRGRVAAQTELAAGDVRDPAALTLALEGVDTAIYLVHAMGTTGSFDREDRTAARSFAAAAADAGVRRIIYLGGLGAPGPLSPHLASRQEVGRILAASGVPTIELRASIVIGPGSLSYDLIRSLVHRLPVMIAPRWVRSLAQPIAVDDVLDYIEAAIDLPADAGRVYEIGGPDRVSYGDLMLEYAHQRGLKRRIVAVPVLTPHLSSLWLGLVTPVYARVGRKLIDGMRNDTIVTDPAATHDFPVRPRGYATAIAEALAKEATPPAARWSDAVSANGGARKGRGRPLKRQLVDSRWVRVPVPTEAAFAPIQRIGGDTGWYYGGPLWRLRGALDLLVGGVGMRRGRRHPVNLAPGDPLDFWRVEAIEPNELLRLVAEMRLPGKAWLQYRVEPDADGSIIRQTAFFDPSGIFGRLYWYAAAPAHNLVFPGMLRRISEEAIRHAR